MSVMGYVLATGVTDAPDARQVAGSPTVRVVWSTQGQLGEVLIDTTMPRVDLSSPPTPWVVAPFAESKLVGFFKTD